MRKALVVGAGMAALALAACASSDVSKAGDIYVKANGVEIQAGGIATFPAATGGSTSSLMKVVIGNAGDAPLTITRITIEEGGNAFMSFNPLPADRDFPHVVDANELTGDTAYQFQIKYNPGSQFDDRKTRIRIESDDHDEGEFLLIVEPQAKAPKIKVVPDNITFVGATSSDPGVQCFEIRNTGTAVLQLTDNLTFELPTSEFQIIPP
ncbi:MAG: hypothetical protein FJ087_19770, partial [Deltaproteobacteria bacterium]|nr:hypothetical protein [Deltaproteobacteria bacterium]